MNNTNLIAIFFSEEDISAGQVKLNTFSQRCCQEVLTGFEPTIFPHLPLDHQALTLCLIHVSENNN